MKTRPARDLRPGDRIWLSGAAAEVIWMEWETRVRRWKVAASLPAESTSGTVRVQTTQGSATFYPDDLVETHS